MLKKQGRKAGDNVEPGHNVKPEIASSFAFRK